MNRIKKGDTVVVISGVDADVQGTVLRVLPKEDRVVVSGAGIVTKHQNAQRAGRSQMQGGRIQYEAPIELSKVMLVCPKCHQATRVGFQKTDERKVRVCRKCGQPID